MSVSNNELYKNVEWARFCAEIAIDEPVNMVQVAKDALRLQKFLDEFLYVEDNEKRRVGRAYRERFDLDDSCKLRQVIHARIERYNKQLSAYVKANR